MDRMNDGENRPGNATSAGDFERGGHRRAVMVLAVLTIVGGLLAVALPAARVYRQRQAVARVEKLGGIVVYDYQYHAGKIDQSATPPGAQFLRKWLGDDIFATVAYVSLGSPSEPGRAVTDADLKVLRSFPQLTVLQIADPRVGDQGLAYVGQLGYLETLGLAWGSFSDSGLENLKGLTRLREIWLHGRGITEKGLDHLAANKGLRRLHLDDTRVTAAGIARQPFASALESLSLSGTDVDDATLAGLDALTGLRGFGLLRAHVTDTGLSPLARLTGLHSLSLFDCPALTDSGLANLRGLSELDELNIGGASFSDAGIEQLRSLRNLRTLTLWSVPLSDRSARTIGDLSTLRVLMLMPAGKITDQGLAALCKLRDLENLQISESEITDAGLPSLLRLRQLQFLELSNSKITDAGVASLGRLGGLKSLTIGPGMTKAGATALKLALPGCEIQYVDPSGLIETIP